jgi:hypothetical protein
MTETADVTAGAAATAGSVAGANRALAAELRARYGFLREVVEEMERGVPYAAALVSGTDGVRLSLRDGEQQAGRRDPEQGVVLTAADGAHLQEVATDATDPDAVRRAARDLVERIRGAASRGNGGGQGAAGGTDGRLRIDPGEPLDRDFATAVEIDPGRETLAEKLERYESLRQRLRGLDRRAVQATLR